MRVETWRIRQLRERERKNREEVLREFSGALEEELREWEAKMEGQKFVEDVEGMYHSFRKGFERLVLG